MKNVFFFIFLTALATVSYAGFYCPDDITINCDMDIHNTDMTGYPTTTGFNVGLPISYFDIDLTNGCGVGQVNRTWHQDLNNDQVIGADEPSCTQVITVDYYESLFDINWPPNRDLSCLEDIAFEAPEIVHGPCDLVGYVWEDAVFELTNDACYKILRTFEVINWCIYDDNNPNGDGRYTYTQVIKITEKELPEFTECQDITISMDEGCQANVSISSTAADVGDCPSEELYWTVEIDLGWDLIVDYEYSYLLTGGEYYLAPTANGEALNIDFPDLIDGGTHGAYYTVKDGCGNVRSCQQKFFVEDQKAPTPYCHAFLTAAFDADAMPAMVPADLFDIGATDNCTATEDIQISFSSDPQDTVKVIDCGSQGFQFFNIYATDEDGNTDFCEVFMLIFDNNGCSFRYAPMGTVKNIEGEAMEGVQIYLTDGATAMYVTESADLGYFQFEYTELISDYYLMTDTNNEQIEQPTIMDLKHLQGYMLGLQSMDASYQLVAADINRDRTVDPFDVIALKNHLLGISELGNEAFSTFIESESISENWRDYKTEIDYMDYDGSFDLLQISLSDMYADHDVEENTVNVITENIDGKTTLSFSNTDELIVQGLEISLQLPTGLLQDQISVSSNLINMNYSDYHYNAENGIWKLISLKDQNITPKSKWLTIMVDTDDVVDEVGLNWIVNNTLVRSEVESKSDVLLFSDQILYQAILVSNIASNTLLLNKQLESGTLEIYNLQGFKVAQVDTGNNDIDIAELPQGVYIIQWSNGFSNLKEKFIKM